jgi:hypothetical protein
VKGDILHIGWVGGLLRSKALLAKTAALAGHSFEAHSGDVRGRGSEGLAGLVERSDLVIIVIEVNSHGGALLAKDLARRRGRRAVIIRKPSLSALNRVLEQLSAEPVACG